MSDQRHSYLISIEQFDTKKRNEMRDAKGLSEWFSRPVSQFRLCRKQEMRHSRTRTAAKLVLAVVGLLGFVPFGLGDDPRGKYEVPEALIDTLGLRKIGEAGPIHAGSAGCVSPVPFAGRQARSPTRFVGSATTPSRRQFLRFS